MLKDSVRARLPKAAQQELDRLEREVAYYKDLYTNATGSTEKESRVSVQTLDSPIYLDEGARVHFVMGEDYDYIEVHLLKEHDGHSVSVRAGSSQLIAHPQSGNSIKVRAEKR